MLIIDYIDLSILFFGKGSSSLGPLKALCFNFHHIIFSLVKLFIQC